MALRNMFDNLALDSTIRTLSQGVRRIMDFIPDTAGRMRVNIETGTLPTVSTVTSVSQLGGITAAGGGPAAMNTAAATLRQNIITR